MTSQHIRKARIYPITKKMVLGLSNLKELNEVISFCNQCDKIDLEIIEDELSKKELYKIEEMIFNDIKYDLLKNYLTLFNYSKVAKLFSTTKQRVHNNINLKFKILQKEYDKIDDSLDIKEYLICKYKNIKEFKEIKINKLAFTRDIIKEYNIINKNELFKILSNFIIIDKAYFVTMISKLKKEKYLKIENDLIYKI